LPVSSGNEAAGLGAGATSYGLTLILSQDVSFGAIHFNLAGGRDEFSAGSAAPAVPFTADMFIHCTGLGCPNEQWKLALEVGHESVSSAGDTTTSQFVQLGAVFSPGKDLDFALGVLRNNDTATPQTSTTTATMGLTWRFR
jgi:hypothetical protein